MGKKKILFMILLGLVVGMFLFLIRSTTLFSHTSQLKTAQPSEGRLVKKCDFPVGDCMAEGKVFFIGDNIGWYACENSLWKTINGGKDWELFPTANAISMLPGAPITNKYYFANATIGWKFDYAQLHKTSNGGNSWEIQPAPFSNGFIEFMSFDKAGKNGYLFANQYYSFPPKITTNLPSRVVSDTGEALIGTVYSTVNGGSTWTREKIEARPGEILRDLFISDTGEVWILFSTSLVFRDAMKWRQVSLKKIERATDVAQSVASFEEGDVSSSIVYFTSTSVGFIGYSNGSLVGTNDKGKSWYFQFNGNLIQDGQNPSYFKQCHFIDNLTGWALANNGKLYKSFDGGKQWVLLNTNSEYDQLIVFSSKKIGVSNKHGIYLLP